jgi:hypothetical protein
VRALRRLWYRLTGPYHRRRFEERRAALEAHLSGPGLIERGDRIPPSFYFCRKCKTSFLPGESCRCGAVG